MSTFTAAYTYGTDSGDYPWMQSLAAFGAPGELLSNVSSLPFSSTVSVTALYAGALLIVEQYTGYKSGETVPGPYAISDEADNDWISLCSEEIAGGGADDTTWWLQVWYCIANEASTSGTEITVTGPPVDEYFVLQQGDVTQFIAATDGTYMGPFLLLASATYNTSTDPPVSGPPSLSVTATNPQLLYSSAIALNGPSESLNAVSPFTLDWNAVSGGYFVAAGEYEVFDDSYVGPVALPIVRRKLLPLSLDFATCTYDQQNRLLQYEIYKALGSDGSLVVPNTPWDPPVTITLQVWSESVDDDWNILKTPDEGEGFCGRIITIDSSASADWAGDYEIMSATYTPFEGDTSGEYAGDTLVQSSGATAAGANSNSGLITLVLRTYNGPVLEACDVSTTPTYDDVPGSLDMYPVVWAF